MSAPTNRWKLGLFVIVSMGVGLLAAAYLAGRVLQKEVVRYTSYFDEAVGGLNKGSPVSYRGVTIGNVSEINIAPDRRHVEVRYDLGVEELSRLGLASDEGVRTRIKVPRELRVQIGSSGVTGTKYLQLDFFRDESHPRPKLPFKVPRNYIPATASTFKSLESSVMQAVDQLPALAKKLDNIFSKVDEFVVEIHAQKLPTHAAESLASATALMAVLHKKLDKLNVDALSTEAKGLLAQAQRTLSKADVVVERLSESDGLMQSVQRATDAVGDVAVNANDVVVDVGTTIRDLRETIEAVRGLAEALERDSDMLVKGRAKASE